MRYSGDPYWITARYNSQCSCGKVITKGDQAYYYPRSRKAVCPDCGRVGASYMQDEIANETLHAM